MTTWPAPPTRSPSQQRPLHLAPWLIATVLLLYLTPTLKYIPHTGHRRPEEFLLLLLLGLVAVRYSLGAPTRVVWGYWQVGMLGFAVVVLVAMLTGSMLGFHTTSTDFFALFRIAKAIIAYTLAATAVQLSANPDRLRRRIVHTIELASILLFPIVVQQYFDLFGLNEHYIAAVARTGQSSDLLTHAYAARAIGMVGNPNQLGFLYSVAATVSIYLIVTAKRWMPAHWLALTIQLAAILMSLSRGAMVATIVSAGYLFITLPSPASTRSLLEIRGRALRILGLLAAIAGVGFILFHNKAVYDAVLWRFARLANTGQDLSWTERLAHWHENLALFVRSPWLGVGPLTQGTLQYAADNEWLLLLRSYGILGTLYLVLAIVGPHVLVRSGPRGAALRGHRRLADAILLASATYMIPAAIFHNMTLMPVVMIVLGSADASSRPLQLRRWTTGVAALDSGPPGHQSGPGRDPSR